MSSPSEPTKIGRVVSVSPSIKFFVVAIQVNTETVFVQMHPDEMKRKDVRLDDWVTVVRRFDPKEHTAMPAVGRVLLHQRKVGKFGRFTHMARADVERFLESNGFDVFDSEPTQKLKEAAFQLASDALKFGF